MGESADAQLHALAQRRSHFARHGFDDADDAIALCMRCDELAEAAFGRKSVDYAHSIQWTSCILRRAAAEKGGGRKAKKEMTHAIELLRESASTLAEALGPQHLDTTRALFLLATGLNSTGAKPDAREAQTVHASAMAGFWGAQRPELVEHSIAQVATLLVEAHLGARAHADAQSEGLAISALLREAIAFEEAGASGRGGPLTMAAHTLRAALARVLEAAGELPAAIAAAEAACECLARGISKQPAAPTAAAAAAAAAPRAPRGKLTPEELAAQQTALELAQAAAAAESHRLAVAKAILHAEAWVRLAHLHRKAERFKAALAAERAALSLVEVQLAQGTRRSSIKAQQMLEAAAKHNERRGSTAAAAIASQGATAAAAAVAAASTGAGRRASLEVRRGSSGRAAPAGAPPPAAAAGRLWLDGALAAGAALRASRDAFELAKQTQQAQQAAADTPGKQRGSVSTVDARAAAGKEGAAEPSSAQAAETGAPAGTAVSVTDVTDASPFQAAAEAAAEALQLAKELAGPQSLEFAQVLELIAELHEAAGHKASAAEAWRQVAAIIRAVVGEGDARYQRCMTQQTRLLTEWALQAGAQSPPAAA